VGTYAYEASYSGDPNYFAQTGDCESFTVNPEVTTTVEDASNNPWNGTETIGATAHDTATVTRVLGFTPTGAVTYRFFKNGTCAGTASTTQSVTLRNGLVPNSNATSALAAASFSFQASYTSSSSNYASSVSNCEPFTVASSVSLVGAIVHDAHGGGPWNGSEVTGSFAYDSATVTKVSGFTPTGTLTYSFFKNGTCAGTASTTQSVTLIGGFIPNSANTAALAAGLYSFQATYSGDANYKKATGACEQFSVAKAPTFIATVVDDAKTGRPWNSSEVSGASAFDTSAVSSVLGFTATGTVTYSFFKNGTCSGTASTTQTVNVSGGIVPKSATTPALTPGSYCFRATYSGDSNYKTSTSSPEYFSVARG
jgi:hypothetical protein